MPSSRHRPLVVASLLAATVLPAAWAHDKGAAPPPPGFIVAMDVVVAPDGRIARVEPDDDVMDPVRAALLRRVPEWRYAAPTWEGRPVEVTMRLALRLHFVPVHGGGYAMRVTEVAPDPAIRITAPEYPQRAMRRGLGGTFTYRVSVGEKGAALDVERTSALLSDDPVVAELESAARKTLERWRWPVPLVDGRPVACQLRVPIAFIPGAGGTSVPRQVPQPEVPFDRPCPTPALQTAIAGVLL